MLNLENLKKAYNLLTKEINENFRELYGTWEMHQLLLSISFIKDLLKAYNETNGIEKANKIYKLIKQESKQ